MEDQKDIIIAVMGATRAGKSTFINLASGGNLGVQSYNSEVPRSHEFELSGRRIVLVDTPGFDDTTTSVTDVLRMVALHLSATYEAGMKLNGVIYMHRIFDVRMNGIQRRNFSMFRKLCGEVTLRNVLVVTTMWDLVDAEIGDTRERELMTDETLFKPALNAGAQMVRHDNTLQTAQMILDRLIHNYPEPLQIQYDPINVGNQILGIDVDSKFARELAAVIDKHLKENVEAIRKEMAEALAAKDLETRRELEEVRQELARSLVKAEQDQARLSREYVEEKGRVDNELQNIREQLAAEREERIRCQMAVAELERRLRPRLQENEKRQQLEALMQQFQGGGTGRGFFGALGQHSIRGLLDGL